MKQEEKSGSFEIVSFYFFIPLADEMIGSIKKDCDEFVNTINLKGLIIVAPEGLNGTVACPSGLLDIFIRYLNEKISEGDWKFKFSHADKEPFKRFSFKIRQEIVTSGHPELNPDPFDESHISAEEWHTVLENEKEYFMIDVRNDYEVKIGSFKGAINPQTSDFKEFPDFIDSCGIPKDKAVYICCTGGIRCEKAYLEMKQKGYNNVYQLDGGILRYLEKYREGHFNGECFVFDDRVALDKDLSPSKKYALCPHCGDPASEYICCSNCGTQKKVCNACQNIPDRMTCSKNCSYHYGLLLDRKRPNSQNTSRKSENSSYRDIASSGEGGFAMFLSVLLVLFVSVFCGFALAESTPEDVAREAITKMQEKGDPSPIVEYVDWDHMYNTLPANNKKVMSVSSPDELKAFYKKVLESPSAEISDLLTEKIIAAENSGNSKIDETKVSEVITKVKDRLKEKEEQVRIKLRESEYTIQKESQEGDTAIVSINHTFESESRTDMVEMHKKDGNWFFTSLSNSFTSK